MTRPFFQECIRGSRAIRTLCADIGQGDVGLAFNHLGGGRQAGEYQHGVGRKSSMNQQGRADGGIEVQNW